MKFCIFTVLLISGFVCNSQAIDHSRSIGSEDYSLDSITTIIGGYETNDTINNKRIVFLTDSNLVNGSVSPHDKMHTYHLSIYGAYKKGTLIYIHLESYVRKLMDESVFAKTANIRAKQELKLLLSDSSIIELEATYIEDSLFPVCVNYCHYHFNVDYSVSEKDLEKLKKYHIIKIVQDYGNDFFLIAKPNKEAIAILNYLQKN